MISISPPPHRIRLRRLTACAGLVCALAVCAAPPAAHAEPVFAIKPATATATNYFVLPLVPGSFVTRKGKVSNVGDTAGVVRLFGVDATTGQTTGAVYLWSERPRRDVGAWLRLSKSGLGLGPHRSQIVDFAVRVPDGVRGGQHLGGLVADNASIASGGKARRGKGSFSVKVHHLTITAVQADLPASPDIRMDITGIHAGGRPGYQTVFVSMGNPGNRMIKPTLSVDATDSSGRHVLKRTTKLDTFLPATRVDYPVAVQKRALPAGTYQGTVVLKLGKRVLDRFTGTFNVTDKQVKQVFGGKGTLGSGSRGGVPWLLIALGVALLVALFAAMDHFRRKARRLTAADEPSYHANGNGNGAAADEPSHHANGNGNGAAPAPVVPARRLDDLAADQRAVLGLLIQQGRSYDEIAHLVSTEPAAVRARAHASLTALAPVHDAADTGSSGSLTPGLAAEIGDYLLGQQAPAAQATTRQLLEASAGARAWARGVAGELRTLQGDRLPDIP